MAEKSYFRLYNRKNAMSNSALQGVLTGDVIGSRQVDAGIWMPILQQGLSVCGEQGLHWAIYRGDSFTCQVPAQQLMRAALRLKATLLAHGGVSIRLGLGIGEVTHHAHQITECQGPAFERSGMAFDELRRMTMKLRTGNEAEDARWDVMLGLAMRAVDAWTPPAAEAVEWALEHPEQSQGDWAVGLGKSQSTISETLKRAAFDELMAMVTYFEETR